MQALRASPDPQEQRARQVLRDLPVCMDLQGYRVLLVLQDLREQQVPVVQQVWQAPQDLQAPEQAPQGLQDHPEPMAPEELQGLQAPQVQA